MLGSIGFASDTKTDYDRSVNFEKYKTFAWRDQALPSNLVDNSLVVSRIRDALREELPSKGLREVKAGPDIYIEIRVAAQEIEDVNYYPTYGYYYGGSNVYVYRYIQGMINIDMIDARTNQLVWRSISTNTGSSLVSVQKQKKIDKMVEEALEHFPPEA